MTMGLATEVTPEQQTAMPSPGEPSKEGNHATVPQAPLHVVVRILSAGIVLPISSR